MLTVHYGTDTIAVREAAGAALAAAREAGAEVVVIDADSYQSGAVGDALGAASLFGGVTHYLLDTPSADVSFLAEVQGVLADLAESSLGFTVIEGPLTAAQKKPYAKHTADCIEHKAAAVERFNTFAMADSLARKDKRTLWLQLMQATAAGLAAEEVIGVLWWQLKSLKLAAVTQSAEAAGMKSFPYQKAKRALSAFKPGEVDALMERLLVVYHDGHAGMHDIDAALERWVLML